MNEKGSLFEYFWKGFNVSLISIGEKIPVFNNQENNGLVWRITDKLFDYLSFYDTFSYFIGISAFGIYKLSKQTEKFTDLLSHFFNNSTESTQKSPSNMPKDITNIEIKTKDEAKIILSEIYKQAEKIGCEKGNVFIRFMVYNVKSQVVSNLHLVDCICHNNLNINAVFLLMLRKI